MCPLLPVSCTVPRPLMAGGGGFAGGKWQRADSQHFPDSENRRGSVAKRFPDSEIRRGSLRHAFADSENRRGSLPRAFADSGKRRGSPQHAFADSGKRPGTLVRAFAGSAFCRVTGAGKAEAGGECRGSV